LLHVELPLPLDSAAATDQEAGNVVSIRTFLDGKLLHEGPYRHVYWQLAELTPGSHDVEILVVDEQLRPVLRGFRESILVHDGPPEAPSMCDFENDPEETLSLRATGDA
jgi:hypothetical protein